MTFREAVDDAPSPVNGAYQPGKRALENKHRRYVRAKIHNG